MSVANFIPELWSAELEVGLENNLVAGAVANRQYEGEIQRAGDVVRVTTVADPTIRNYTKSDITIDPIPTTQRSMPIDQQKYFAHAVDDVDAAQTLNAGALMMRHTDRGGYQLANTEDSYILGLHAQAGITLGTDAAPLLISTLNVEKKIAEIGRKFDDAGVPQAGRFCIVPPWWKWKMVQAGLNTLTDNADLYSSGFIGTVLDIDFLWSQNIAHTSLTKYKIMGGVMGRSWAAASQLLQLQAFEQEKRFDDALKALHVYGGKVMRPDMTITVTANEQNE